MRAASNLMRAGLALLFLWVPSLAPAQDDPPGRVGRLAAVQGEVWVFEPDQGEWIAALANRPFTGGDRIATGSASTVEVRIGSTTLLLGSQAELEALRLDDERMQFTLQRGTLGLQLRSNETAVELELKHAEARFLPRRAGLYRIDRQDWLSEAAVLRGDLQVEGHNLGMTLYAGQRAAFWRDGPLGDTRSQWLGAQLDDFALALQTMEQADTRTAAALFVPPEMTGAEDLERHGRWQQHPDYGAVWSPNVVAVDWVPYRYGQWVWQRPWGWTWVDDAPWGFAPFHYGRWLWWGNRWCWTPGPKTARPVFAPALVGWVGGPQFSVAVGNRPVPAVGWLPLGPRDVYRPGYSASPGHVRRLNPQAPPGPLPPPAFANRGAPGALTFWPGTAPSVRQPVAAAALRADEMALRSLWQAENFHHNAPGRPPSPARDQVAPRAMVPWLERPPGPARPPAAGQGTLLPRPPPMAVPTAPSGQAPFHGRPPNALPPQREHPPRPVAQPVPLSPRPAPPLAQAPVIAQPVPAAPARAQPFTPAVPAATPPKPQPAAPRNDVDEPRNPRQNPELGERRRTPESRGTQRER